MTPDTLTIPDGWSCIHTLHLPSRPKKTFPFTDIALSRQSVAFLGQSFPEIYGHQKAAIRCFLEHKHICLTTGTSSGKSLPFYLAGIETLVANPQARILAIYPIKALGYEQEERWKSALKSAGMDVEVGRIDGQVPTKQREAILKKCRVLIVTPDIIHAWMLSNLSQPAVINYLKRISLLIVDEVHSYTGVFGSNSAFLFRRLQHALNLLGAKPLFLTASATIAEPKLHLQRLFGLEFHLIDATLDTSPRHPVDIHLLNPPSTSDLLTSVSNLLESAALEAEAKFIAFVDSRKQAEHLSSILARKQGAEEIQEEQSDVLSALSDHLRQLNVLPFRAGFEEHDRNIIQDRLRHGNLRGIVSTSALELGIDIPKIRTGILVGVPRSSTSLFQRIGRIGRHSAGEVFVINTGSIYDESIYRDPANFMNRPVAEGALYLENPRIQYIQALCLARTGGEHDQIISSINRPPETELTSCIQWPNGFMELCKNERLGVIPTDLQNIKSEAGDDPNHIFPLRDVESQFKIVMKQGPDMRNLGSVSYHQLMREAYPGGIYYY